MDLDLIRKLANAGYSSSEISEIVNIPQRKLYKTISDIDLEALIRKNSREFSSKNLSKFNKIKHDNLFKEYGDIVCKLISDEKSFLQINKELNLSYKQLNCISKFYKIHDQFKKNNQKCKSNRLKSIGNLRRSIFCNDFLKIHKDEFIDLVNSGILFGELCSKYKLSYGKCKLILNELNLLTCVENNFKLYSAELQKINSKKGADKVRGSTIIRHKIIPEMELQYMDYMSSNIFEGEARQRFKQRFKTCGPHTWNFLKQKYGQLIKHPAKFLPGPANKMFGKEPCWKTGTGIKGHILYNDKLIYFRSSLELMVFIYLLDHKIDFELSKHIVRYQYNGKVRNYFQDIVIGDMICEIKPEIKLNWEQNIKKFEALQAYCHKFNLKCKYITETTYELSYIKMDKIDEMIKDKRLFISDSELIRLKKYLK